MPSPADRRLPACTDDPQVERAGPQPVTRGTITADREVEIRVYADGRRLVVCRQTWQWSADVAGQRTVHIDALVD